MAAGNDMRDLLEILALLTPYDVPDMMRRRFGNRAGDGGYVLLEQLLTDQPVISAGIGRQISFDLEMADRGHEVHMFDHTIEAPPSTHPLFRFQRMGVAPAGQEAENMTSLDLVLAALPAGRSDIVLKMDIEGGEWAILRALPRAALRRFSMLSLELHGLPGIADVRRRPPVLATLQRLAADFTLFHVHANNAGQSQLVHGFHVHPLLELSYVRTDLVRRAPNRTVYPSPLDPPNVPGNPEVALWHYPFLPTACSPAELAAEMQRCALQLDLAALRVADRAARARNRALEQQLATKDSASGGSQAPSR